MAVLGGEQQSRSGDFQFSDTCLSGPLQRVELSDRQRQDARMCLIIPIGRANLSPFKWTYLHLNESTLGHHC